VQLGTNLKHSAMSQTRNIIIPAHIVFDENWSFANGHLTDRLPNAPNTNTEQTIIADGIRLGQTIY
ncbi:10636_t:CDS:1, partial [Scutellospora calospora]